MAKQSLKVAILLMTIIVVPSEAGYCTKPTDCQDGELAVYEHGEQVTLALAWSSDADRAALALLYWVLRDQGYCRVSLCETTSLCDLFDNPASYNITNGLVIGYHSIKEEICGKGHLKMLNGIMVPAHGSQHYLLSEINRLMIYARQLYRNLESYKPNENFTIDILALENKTSQNKSLSAINAVAIWAKNNLGLFNESSTPALPQTVEYIIVIYQCRHDDVESDRNLIEHLTNLKIENNNNFKNMYIFVHTNLTSVDCEDRKDLSRHVIELAQSRSASRRVIGVIAAGAGVMEAARIATKYNFSLVSYDAQPQLLGDDYISFINAGPRATELARALNRTLASCGWRRVALLSDDTPLAEAVTEVLRVKYILKEMNLPQDNKSLIATLHALKKANARVIVLNSGIKRAANALAIAAKLEMTRAQGYMWVVLEAPLNPPMSLLALRARDNDLTRPQFKFHLSTPLINAFNTLMLGYANTVKNNKKLRYDHNTKETLILLRKILLMKHNITVQDLMFDQEGIVQPPISLKEYDDNNNITLYPLEENFTCPESKISDGSRNCTLLINSEDAFAYGTCVDLAVIISAPVFLVTVLIAVRIGMVWRDKLHRRRKDQEHLMRAEACAALLERQGGTVAVLAGFHVERSRINLLQELGQGRHGRVWLAELDGTRLVAAKVPHSGCAPIEESELLREAATLAGLRHENIVSLVGVCVVGGPPLLLTAKVHFGDLQGYLQQRRGFLSAAHKEAQHVSAAALTRLACEAAQALAYLTSQALVHCDVRAANCLIDERRSLKLADFGMARVLGTGEGAAESEYLCRRRKLVPVRWMPPESLTEGVFSPASDVWALGVLVLELVTLGERPFGALGSHEVLALVSAGGYARLPLGCTVDTRRLALACWQRLPAERPSAATVATYLADNPYVLKPTPHLDIVPRDGDSDSGFGFESLPSFKCEPSIVESP